MRDSRLNLLQQDTMKHSDKSHAKQLYVLQAIFIQKIKLLKKSFDFVYCCRKAEVLGFKIIPYLGQLLVR